MAKAVLERERRAAKVLRLDDAVSKVVAALKERGLTSPYLKPFVIARVNPIRFSKATEFDFDEVMDKMIAAASDSRWIACARKTWPRSAAPRPKKVDGERSRCALARRRHRDLLGLAFQAREHCVESDPRGDRDQDRRHELDFVGGLNRPRGCFEKAVRTNPLRNEIRQANHEPGYGPEQA